MEKPVPAVANGDLLRGKNDADRISGVLGIHVARAHTFMAFSEVDGGDGRSCPSKSEKLRRLVKRLVHTRQVFPRINGSGLGRCRPQRSKAGFQLLQPVAAGLGFCGELFYFEH